MSSFQTARYRSSSSFRCTSERFHVGTNSQQGDKRFYKIGQDHKYRLWSAKITRKGARNRILKGKFLMTSLCPESYYDVKGCVGFSSGLPPTAPTCPHSPPAKPTHHLSDLQGCFGEYYDEKGCRNNRLIASTARRHHHHHIKTNAPPARREASSL